MGKIKQSRLIGRTFLAVVSCLLLLVSASPGLADMEWEWQHPLPVGNNLKDVYAVSDSDVFMVGEFGTILHYDGATYDLMESGVKTHLFGVWAGSADDVFAVGWETPENDYMARILHYDGSAWSEMACPATDWLAAVWGSSGSDVFAVGRHGAIQHYDGSTWSDMTDSVTYINPDTYPSYLHGVWGSSGSDVFAVGEQIVDGNTNTALILHYNGSTWTEMACSGAKHLYDVWGTSAGDVFAVGYDDSNNAIVIHYDGATWSEVTIPVNDTLYAVWGNSGSDVFAAGHGGTLLHYDGATWSEMTSPVTDRFHGVWGSSGSDVFAVGGYGRPGLIAHYDGSTWSLVTTYKEIEKADIWGSALDNIYTVGRCISHYDGNTWTQATCSSGCLSDAAYSAVWGSSAGDVFAVGSTETFPYESFIAHYEDGTWCEMTTPSIGSLNDVWGSSSSDVFAVSDTGGVLHYDGSIWSEMSPPSTADSLEAVWGSSAGDVFAVGFDVDDYGVVFHYDGATWSEMTSPVSRYHWLMGVWGSGSDDVFVVGYDYVDEDYDAVILHYDGATWSEMTCPSNEQMLMDVWGTSAGDVFAVGGVSVIQDIYGPGLILHYDGSAWTEMSCPGSDMLYDLWGSSAADVFALGHDMLLHYDGVSGSSCVDPAGALDIMGAQATLEEGAIIRVPINLRNAYKPDPANDVYALGFDVAYDTQVLDFVAFELGALLAGFTMTGDNEIAEGVIRIGGFSYDDPISADEEGVLGYLTFQYFSSPRCAVLEPYNLKDHIETWSAPLGYLLPGVAPTADAGEDRDVKENALVTLDGSDSFDPDDGIKSYFWEQTAGPSVTLSDPDVVQPTFTVPSNSSGERLTFQLTVTDYAGASDTDTVTLSIVEYACLSAPDKPVLIFPQNGASHVSLTPTLQSSPYNDPEDCSTHFKTRWQISKKSNFQGLTYNANTFREELTSHQVTKKVLKPDTTYYWRVKYWGDHGIKSEWSDVFIFTTGSDDRDCDGDGVPDGQASAPGTDINENGTPDENETNLRSLLTPGGVDNIGLEFSDDVVSIAIETMSEDQIRDLTNMTGELPYGLMAFRVKLAELGATASFTVHLQNAAPDDAVWYKQDNVNGWYDFTPSITFSPNRKSLVFHLTDGGIGDADGFVNGVIVDPCGLGHRLRPRAPALNTPNAAIHKAFPEYSWDTVANADTYKLVIKNRFQRNLFSRGYDAAVVDNGDGTCSVIPGMELAPGDYYWLIIPANEYGQGDASELVPFTVEDDTSPKTPAAPALNTPAGTTDQAFPAYNWNAVADADTYKLVVKNRFQRNLFSRGYDAAMVDNGDGTCSVIPGKALAPGDYYWLIIPANEYGQGDASALMPFTVDTTQVAPAAPTLNTPAGTIYQRLPAYSWNAVADADSYKLAIKNRFQRTLFYRMYDAAMVDNGDGTCSITPGKRLTEGDYYWLIIPANEYGQGDASELMPFTVDRP